MVAVNITLNGENRSIAPGTSIRQLLHELGLNAEATAVQRNDEIIGRSAYGETIVDDGDRIELVRFVGGG